ncbi:uncharacterized protein [Triticum aestivum]|uniref:uncharacterized protein n=1 Tax=Triticum aestivum TaxID=4565 RepID=UPI00084245E0|nr:uncharacterized protein LOC120973760 [Aegilops tauschii subsp. strangulata]XP_044328923.1 uncharacterized protein LOC123050154 [Triticum aestivum]
METRPPNSESPTPHLLRSTPINFLPKSSPFSPCQSHRHSPRTGSVAVRPLYPPDLAAGRVGHPRRAGDPAARAHRHTPFPVSVQTEQGRESKRPHQTDDMWRGSLLLLLLLLAAAAAAEPASTLMGASHEDRGHAMVLPETGPPVQRWATGVSFNPYYLCICICILALHLG